MKKNTTTKETTNVGVESKISNLDLYVKNAYNIKDDDFLGDQVFEVTYNDNKEVLWNGEKKIYPDQLNSIDMASNTEVSNEITIMKNISSYNKMFSIAIDAAYTNVSYDASANSKYIYRGDMFTQSDSYYALNTHRSTLASFERGQKTTTLNFQTVIHNLDEDISKAASKKKYFDFFDRFGTHYVTKGSLGGSIRVETQINSLLYNKYSEEEIKGEISFAYKKLVTNAKLTLGVTYNASSFFETHKELAHMKVSVHGGIAGNDRTIWLASCYKIPSILFNTPDIKNKQTQLASISDLCENTKIRENMETLLSMYVKTSTSKGIALLNQPNINTVEKSSHDSFLISRLESKSNGGRSHVEGFIGDKQADLQFKLGASQHFYNNQDIHIGTNTMCMPVYNSAYFESKFNVSSADSDIKNTFFSIGNGESRVLGDYKTISFEDTHKKEVDGFVVGSVNGFKSNGSRSFISGFQEINGETKQVIGASQQFNGDSIWTPMNSFCMPVKANTNFRVDYITTSGSPEGNAYFIPILGDIEFADTLLYRNTNVTYTAETDGFLIALMQDGGDGNRGYLDVFSSTNTELEKEGPIASTSVHFVYGGDRHIGQNAITIPIPKGNKYKLALTNTWGHCNVTAHWIPTQAISRKQSLFNSQIKSSIVSENQFNIALKASNEKYICAEGNGEKALIADRDAIGSWETFSMIFLPRVSLSGNKLVAFKAANQKYVTANGEQSLIASSDEMGANEVFELIESEGKFALIASNKKYVCNQDDGARALSADRSKLGAWELFQIEIPTKHLSSKKVSSISEIEAFMHA